MLGSCRPGHAAAPKDNPPSETYDPNPAVYEAFGVSTPPAVTTAPYSSVESKRQERPEARKLLTEMLTDAKRRGFTIMIFQAQSGAPPDTVRATRPLLTPIPQPPASCPSTGHLTFLGRLATSRTGRTSTTSSTRSR